MADTVEMQGIEFQIVNDSSAASAGVEQLSKKLAALKSSISGSTTALSKVASGISAIKNAVNNMNTGDFASKMNRISDSLARLKDKTDSLKISASIGNQLTAISKAVDRLPDAPGGKLKNLAEGLQPLSTLGKSNMTTFINQLKKLPEVIEKLEKADIDKFTTHMKDLAAAMKPFADEMNKVASGFSAFPSKIQKLITSTEEYNNAVGKATNKTSAWEKAIKKLSFVAVYRAAVKFLGNVINKASEYQEDLNLFTVSMGEYAEEAYNYAQKVSEVVGIDPAEWMRNQGVFNTIITGFGVAGDKAAYMSKNLTQLGYDLASFYNIDFESAMQKVQSGIAGELEPLRRLGYDLSVARLEQERLNLGIDKSVSSMTQAEKSQLRYYAMMTQVTQVQGDMARTLEQPANMLRVLRAQFEQCARAIGNLFIPILTKVLPIAIAVADGLRQIISAIAGLFGVTLNTPDWNASIGNATSGTEDIADNMGSAVESAKELKRYLAPFDELNVLPDQSTGNGGSGSGAGLGAGSGDLGIDLPGYDFLKNAVTSQIDEWKKKMQPIVDWIIEHLATIREAVEGIATSFLAWKISQSLITGIENLKEALNGMNNLNFKIGGLAALSDLSEFLKALKDIQENGANFSNVTKAVSEFIGLVGDFSIMKGETNLGGALKIAQGVGEIASAVKSIADNGANWDNVPTVLRGVSNLIIGFGAMKGDVEFLGVGFTLQGVITLTTEFKNLYDAWKTGDWSDFSWGTLAVGAVETIFGVMAAFGKLKGLVSKTPDTSTVGQAMQQATQSTETLSTGTAVMSTKMLGLVKNVGLGVVALAEVAAGVVIFAGAIAVVGWELDKAAKAWQPVIDNAGTVAIAVGVGTGLMVAIGAACYGLGTLGATAALNIGVGTAILLELGVATGLFVAEIWAIGKGLDEVGKAWEPVKSNGGGIAEDIGIGTGLLVGIGVVTAALGAATIATGATLPIAIGLGTALLLELSGSFMAFTGSLSDVANELSDNLAPSLRNLNGTLPTLKSDMHDFTEFMTGFATEVSDYTRSMGKITWSTIVSNFKKLFAGNPMKSFADDVGTIATDTEALNRKLIVANSDLETAVTLLTDYVALMSTMKKLTGDAGTIELSTGIFANLKDAGANLVTGFSDGMVEETPNLVAAFDSILAEQDAFSTKFLSRWEKMWSDVNATFKNESSELNRTVTETVSRIKSAFNFDWHLPSLELPHISVTYSDAPWALARFFGIYSIPHLSVDWYANGGFPDAGQLFIANEAGPEMVGSIGGKTAVANNDQIVDGITYGVREANDDVVTAIYAVAQQIIAEMRNQGSGNGGGGGYDFDRAVYEANRRNARVYG